MTSSPWLPSLLVRPNSRSFRIGSLPVPQRQGKTEDLLIVADAVQAILTPAVGPAAGGVVAERLPGGPARTVVLADRAPLTLAQVRAPLLPSNVRWLVQACLFVHECLSFRLREHCDDGRLDAAAVPDVSRNPEARRASNGHGDAPDRSHWPEYLIEAGAIGTFMVSAAVFAAVLYHPSSPVSGAVSNELGRRGLMGLAMGATAVAIIYSPWGQRSGAHMNPAVTLTFFRLGKVARPDVLGYVMAQFAGAHPRDRRRRRRPARHPLGPLGALRRDPAWTGGRRRRLHRRRRRFPSS